MPPRPSRAPRSRRHPWALLAGVLLARAAAAATPVVFEGGTGPDALAAVAMRTGLPADQLTAVPVDTLLTGPPKPLGAAALRRCPGAPVPSAEVEAEIARAQASVAAGDLATALNQLDLVVSRLGCLGEVVVPSAVARAFRLRAEVAAKRADPEALASEVRAEIAFDPDGRLPVPTDPALAERLAAERAGGARVPVSVVGAPSSGPWLDGRPLAPEVQVGAGVHLFQVAAGGAIVSGWLTVGAEPVPVVVPAGFRRPVLSGLGSADPLPAARLVAVALDGPAAYAVADGGMWLVSEQGGAVEVTQLVAPAIEAPPEPRGKSGRKR